MERATIRALFEACYLGKRILDLLPALPEEVSPSYIRCLDVIRTLEQQGIRVRVSDISGMLNLPRPGVTRTVREMERRGYLSRQGSDRDGRVSYITATPAGKELHQRYDEEYFRQLGPYLGAISEQEARQVIQTMQRFYQIMLERRHSDEQ